MSGIEQLGSTPSEAPPESVKRKKRAIERTARASMYASPDKLIEGERYSWLDSGLDLEPESGTSLGATFRNLVPKEERTREWMREHIERHLAEKEGKAIGLEFGGIGSRIFASFKPGFFARSAAVSLMDYRDHLGYGEKELAADAARHHSVIEGDLVLPDTYRKIEKWLAGEKADLILERMGMGLDLMPKDPYACAAIMARWYSMLAEGGLMFLQIPRQLSALIYPWKNKVDEAGGVNLQFAATDKNLPENLHLVMRMEKLAGAPEELPLLSPRAVRAINAGR